MYKLNNTPVRTARNFGINNIKLEDIKQLDKVKEFNNVTILDLDDNVILKNEVSKVNLKYGVGEELAEELETNANQKIRLEIKDKVKLEIRFSFDKENIKLVDNIEIVVEENSTADIIIKYNGIEDLEYYHNGILRVFAKPKSNINITYVNLINSKSDNFFSIQNEIEENATLNYSIIDFGGKNSITNYYSNLERKFVKEFFKYYLFRKR